MLKLNIADLKVGDTFQAKYTQEMIATTDPMQPEKCVGAKALKGVLDLDTEVVRWAVGSGYIEYSGKRIDLEVDDTSYSYIRDAVCNKDLELYPTILTFTVMKIK